jgi:hypothetical protein
MADRAAAAAMIQTAPRVLPGMARQRAWDAFRNW